ncbi:MAG TPA: hypothetical protein VK767_13380 [Bradyrhizobium sp.]|nr:hypothetical protein [Bradyrhizobium sp.]
MADEAVAPGFGKSEGRIRRTRPGLSARQSPNAAVPVSDADWAKAGIEPATTPAPASSDATSNADIDGRTKPNGCALEILGVVVGGRFMFGALLFVDVEVEGTGRVAHRREEDCRVDDDVSREPIRGWAVISAAGLAGRQREWNFWMCDVCEQLDEKIEHYKKVMAAMTDQLTIDGITALIAELQARKAELHPKQK